MTLALETKGICKRFGGVMANRNVDLAVREGTVHAIVGENGAGKTTLMNILYGLYAADAGELRLFGREAKIKSPSDAIRHGIGMIHQHFMLVPTLTVAENITMGLEPKRLSFLVDRRRAEAEVRALGDKFGLNVDPAANVGSLPVSLQQRVEILKALFRGARILILDEPTALLTPQETEEFLRIIRGLRAGGRTVVFISHKLAEVMAVADDITVMRGGEVVAVRPRQETDEADLAELMVGRPVLFERYESTGHVGGFVLQVEGLTVLDGRGRQAVRNLSFSVRAGEIVGIAGVAGNGQSELVLALAGYLPVAAGRIILGGHDLTHRDIRSRRQLGLALIPEDRSTEGLIGRFTVAENLSLGRHDESPLATGFRLNLEALRSRARDLIDRFRVYPPDPTIQARLLSGGNQQKVIVARECADSPRLLIAAQPSRGLDIGAVEFVHQQLVARRNAGDSVLLVSLSLDEIMLLSDRILVMYRGESADFADNGARTASDLGLFMMRGSLVEGGKRVG